MATWLILLQVCTVAAVTYIENTYEVEKGELSHLVIEKSTGRVFVGATNWLYEFDKDLDRKKGFQTGPKADNPNCVPRISSHKCDCSSDDCEEKLMENYNKGLVIDNDHGHLIACSSLYHGYCEKHKLNDISQIVLPTSYWPVVANNATASTFIFIGPGPIKDENEHWAMVLYVGATRTINGPLQTRDRFVPAFCSRKLTGDPSFKFAYKDPIAGGTYIQVESLLRATFPIHYIYGFSDSSFSYMITIQKQSSSVESYVTKILRVCNRDQLFYSYAEVQLQCRHDSKLYNLAQAASYGKAGLKLAKSVGQGEEYLFVMFSTGSQNSPDTNAASTSALCVYPMHKIKSVFTKNTQQCFEGYGNTGPAHVIGSTNCLPTVS